MQESKSALGRPVRVGVIAEQTGPLSFMGMANANVARMVVEEINAAGGLLGEQVALYIEDGETTDSVAEVCAARLVKEHHVDVVFGGIYSSTREAIKAAAVERGRTLYIYPEQYEGQESDPLIYCTGPVPTQQVEPLISWVIEQTGAKKWALPSADYVWPRVMNMRVRELVEAAGGEIVEEDYYPLEHEDYSDAVERIMSGGAEVVFNTTVPPGVFPLFGRLQEAGFMERGGQIVCTYFDENCLGLFPPEQIEGLFGCLDYYQAVDDPFSGELLERYQRRFPNSALLTGGSACSGLYRGMRLWESAVREAGSLEQAAVLAALDHAKITDGPGGAAEMVPGQHHVRMNMYIAQVRGGELEVVKSLGNVDPDEPAVPVLAHA